MSWKDRLLGKRVEKGEELQFSGLQKRKDFNEYADLAIRRSQEAREFSPSVQKEVHVVVPDDAIVNFISDIHAFHPTSDIKRVKKELQTIMKTKNSYIIWGGDLIEGIFWGGASHEQIGSLDEQRGFLKEMFRMTEGRTLGAVSGEHDSKWAQKTGADPYYDFTEQTGAPYKRGILEIGIRAGDMDYSGIVTHKLRGNSIYNNAHPAIRASREIQGHDFYFAGHTHRKGLSLQPVRERGGSRMVAYGIGGPYKEEDEYTQRSGWLSQKSKQLYGFSVRFDPESKHIEMNEDIIKANKNWG